MSTTIKGDKNGAITSASLSGITGRRRLGWSLFREQANGFRLFSDAAKTTEVARYLGPAFWQNFPTGPAASRISEATLLDPLARRVEMSHDESTEIVPGEGYAEEFIDAVLVPNPVLDPFVSRMYCQVKDELSGGDGHVSGLTLMDGSQRYGRLSHHAAAAIVPGSGYAEGAFDSLEVPSPTASPWVPRMYSVLRDEVTGGGGHVSGLSLLSGSGRYGRLTTAPGIVSFADLASGGSTNWNCVCPKGLNGAPLYVRVGAGGAIQTSTDAVSWTTRSSGVTSTLNYVTYKGAGANQGYWVAASSYGGKSVLLYSVDGVTWEVREISASAGNFSCVLFDSDNPDNGFACWNGYSQWYTKNGGTSWTSIISGISSSGTLSVVFVSGYALTATFGVEGNRVVRLNIADATPSFTSMGLLGASQQYMSVKLLASGRVVVGSNTGNVYYSDTPTTAGTWTEVATGAGVAIRLFEANSRLYAIGSGGVCRVSSDGGATWAEGPASGVSTFLRFGIADPHNPTRAIVVGDSGTTLTGKYPFRIAAYASSFLRGAAPLPTSWWSFDADKISGTTVADLGGLGNVGTLVGSPTFEVGKMGRAIVLNGSSQYVSYGNVLNMGLSNFSISVWFKSTDTRGGNANGIVWKSSTNGTTDVGYGLSMQLGRVRFFLADGTNLRETFSTLTYNDGAWHHVVVTVERGVATRLYIDGALITNQTTSLPTGTVSGTQPLRVGFTPGTGGAFNGSIEAPRIFRDRVLTADEAAAMYASENAGIPYAPIRAVVGNYADQQSQGASVPLRLTLEAILSVQVTGILPGSLPLDFNVERFIRFFESESDRSAGTPVFATANWKPEGDSPAAHTADITTTVGSTVIGQVRFLTQTPATMEFQAALQFLLTTYSSPDDRAEESGGTTSEPVAYDAQPSVVTVADTMSVQVTGVTHALLPVDFDVIRRLIAFASEEEREAGTPRYAVASWSPAGQEHAPATVPLVAIGAPGSPTIGSVGMLSADPVSMMLDVLLNLRLVAKESSETAVLDSVLQAYAGLPSTITIPERSSFRLAPLTKADLPTHFLIELLPVQPDNPIQLESVGGSEIGGGITLDVSKILEDDTDTGNYIDVVPMPIDYRALKAMQRLLKTVRQENGFNSDILHVYLEAHDFENRQDEGVNLIWGRDTSLNARGRDRSLNVDSWESEVWADVVLSKDGDLSLRKAAFRADMVKLFETWPNYHLADEDGSHLVQNIVLESVTPYGDNQSGPNHKLQVKFLVFWKTKTANAYEVAA